MTLPTPRTPEEASHAVLLEVLSVLGLYTDGIVVVGGWVPSLVFPGRGHVGSLDVDLALDAGRIRSSGYESIRGRLLAAGYVQDELHRGVFRRAVGPDPITVRVDMITGLEGDASSALVQDLQIGRLRGVEIAIDHAAVLTLAGRLPGGERGSVRARVVSIPAFLCMKAFALSERKKDKDGYDIYFCLANYGGGPPALAEAMRPVLDVSRGLEAVAMLREHFAAIDSVGPVGAGRFARGAGGDEEQVRRAAFELARRLLGRLG